jgi:hypothetical protein
MRQALDRITLADLLRNEGRLTELLRSRLAEAVLQPGTAETPLLSLSLLSRGAAAADLLPELSSGMTNAP